MRAGRRKWEDIWSWIGSWQIWQNWQNWQIWIWFEKCPKIMWNLFPMSSLRATTTLAHQVMHIKMTHNEPDAGNKVGRNLKWDWNKNNFQIDSKKKIRNLKNAKKAPKKKLQTSLDVSHVVTHHSTKSAQLRLTSQFGMGYGAFGVVWTFAEGHNLACWINQRSERKLGGQLKKWKEKWIKKTFSDYHQKSPVW